MTKICKKTLLIWGIFFLIYFLFIAFFSYLYPLTKDEILAHKVTTFPLAWKAIKLTYHYNTLRFGPFLGIYLMVWGKSFFIFANPFMQLASVLSVFYFIYLRFPSLKDLKDFAPFLLITLLCTFFIAKPDNTIFWMGGAATYSWPFIVFMLLLIYLRKYYKASVHQTCIWLIPFYLLLGFCVGWLHENTSPMAFCIMFAFAAWFIYKKRKLDISFWAIFVGIIAGLVFYFTSPGLHMRLSIPELQQFIQLPLHMKILYHIPKMDDLFALFLYIPVFIPILLLYRCYKLKKDFLKNENLILSTLCLICGMILAMVLCMAPLVPERAFYSASVMFVCSFLFLVRDFETLCEFNLVRTLATFLLIWVLMLMPIFYISYHHLYHAYQERQKYIDHAYATGQKRIYLEMIHNLHNFPDNLSTLHYDPIGYYTTYEKYLGLQIDSDIPPEERRN